jgi:hypothetical protein
MADFEKYVPHAHFSVAAATFFLVGVGVWGVIATKSALEATQRAWVSPLGAQVSVRPEVNRGIHFAINLTNTGREPAVDLNYKVQNHIIDAYDSRFADMTNIVVPQNTACDNLHPVKGRSIVAPAVQNFPGIAWTFDSQQGDPSLLADDKIVNGIKFYVAEGCFVYDTYQAPHKTSYCYILEYDEMKISVGSSPAILAPNIILPPNATIPGVDPNQVITAHTYVFSPCSTGFEAD